MNLEAETERTPVPPALPLIQTQILPSAPALRFDHKLTWLIVLTAGEIRAFLLFVKAKAKVGYPPPPKEKPNERKEINNEAKTAHDGLMSGER